MIAGLPGTGLGGIFYLLSAFFIPVRELLRMFRGKSKKGCWKFAFTQGLMAVGVILGFWVTGWLLGVIAQHTIITQPDRLNNAQGFEALLKGKTLLISIGVLVSFLVFVEALNLFIHRRNGK